MHDISIFKIHQACGQYTKIKHLADVWNVNVHFFRLETTIHEAPS